MIVKVECRDCGNIRCFRATDLALVYGGQRKAHSMKFRCAKSSPERPCDPVVLVNLLEIDRDRLPKITVWRPHDRRTPDGRLIWMPERLR